MSRDRQGRIERDKKKNPHPAVSRTGRTTASKLHCSHHVPNITYSSIVDKLPQNIIWCKVYGIQNAQNKTHEMLNGT